jgi:hypothetical protein
MQFLHCWCVDQLKVLSIMAWYLNILVMIYKNWIDNVCTNCFHIEKSVANYLLQKICCSMNMKMSFKSMATLEMNKPLPM